MFDSRCTKRECYLDGVTDGIIRERLRAETVITEMKETADAMMWTEYSSACDKILEALRGK